MIESTLVLAAHGSHGDIMPAVNDRILLLARGAAGLGGFDVGVAAFHQGSPLWAEVLDRYPTEQAVVVPFMAADGYYCDSVLPGELAKNGRAGQTVIHITGPVGQHAALIPLVEARASRLLGEHGVSPARTTLAIVGHGTPRHPRSRQSTEQLATSIASRGGFAEVITAFLDEEPGVESIPRRASCPNILVEPFLINDAHHTLVDVPQRLGLTPAAPADAAPPPEPQDSAYAMIHHLQAATHTASGSKGGTAKGFVKCVGPGPLPDRHGADAVVSDTRFVLCDSAVGTDETILGIIIALAIQGRTALAQRAAGAV